MTNTPDRLDRIEGILAIVAQAQQTNTGAIAALTTDVTALTTDVAALTTDMDTLRDIVMHQVSLSADDRVDIRAMQSQVIGLQTENRRILDYLVNRNGGNSPLS